MKNAVICGFGVLGEQIAHHLLTEKVKVYGIRRSIKSSPGVEMIYSDIFQMTSIPSCSYLFYLIPPESKDPSSYKKAYVHGLNHILSLISTHRNPPKIILRSSTDIYKDSPGQYLTEDTKIVAHREVTRVLLQSEQRIKDSKYAYLILRLPQFEEKLIEDITKQIYAGKMSYAKRQNPIHFISCKKAANAVYCLINQQGTYNLCSSPTQFNTLVSMISSKIGKQVHHPKQRQYYASKPTISYEKAVALGSLNSI